MPYSIDRHKLDCNAATTCYLHVNRVHIYLIFAGCMLLPNPASNCAVQCWYIPDLPDLDHEQFALVVRFPSFHQLAQASTLYILALKVVYIQCIHLYCTSMQAGHLPPRPLHTPPPCTSTQGMQVNCNI